MNPCAVGRKITHPDLPTWRDECPRFGTETLVLFSLGDVLHFCEPHMQEYIDQCPGEVEELTSE